MAQRTKPAMDQVMRSVFFPKSIAIYGASTKRANTLVGARIELLKQVGFPGRIYPVHPAAGTLHGLPAFAGARQLPEPVDSAYVGIPAAQVPGVIRDLKGLCPVAHVFSSGFTAAEEADLLAAARESGVRLLGPNCIGVYSPAGRVGFAWHHHYKAGAMSMVAQSGGLTGDIASQAEHNGLHFGKVVTVGNSLDLNAVDFLEYFVDDPDTRTIAVYMETIKSGNRLIQALRRAAATGKPVVLLKGGATPAGQRAAVSHTGAMASDVRVLSGVCRQTGTILVDSLDAFLSTLTALQGAPALSGNRAIVVGTGGGASVLSADACHRAGLTLPPLPAAAQEQILAMNLGEGVSVENPVDLPNWVTAARNGKVFAAVLEVLLQQPVDVVIPHINLPPMARHDPDIPAQIAREMAPLLAGRTTPATLVVARSTGEERFEQQKQQMAAELRPAGVPIQPDLFATIAAAGRMAQRGRYLADRGLPIGGAARPGAGAAGGARVRAGSSAPAVDITRLLGPVTPGIRRHLPEPAAKLALAKAMPALKVPRSELCQGADAAVATAERIGFPVVVKIVSPAVTHKSDVGGVHLSLRSGAAVRTACADIAALGLPLSGYLVEQMVPPGPELLVGCSIDPAFGPIITFGLGGTLTELLAEVAIRTLPLTERDALDLLAETRAARLLGGFRNFAPVPATGLVQALLALGGPDGLMLRHAPPITELEINPLVATPAGLFAVDVRIVVG